jgi:hypothetical protein
MKVMPVKSENGVHVFSVYSSYSYREWNPLLYMSDGPEAESHVCPVGIHAVKFGSTSVSIDMESFHD